MVEPLVGVKARKSSLFYSDDFCLIILFLDNFLFLAYYEIKELMILRAIILCKN